MGTEGIYPKFVFDNPKIEPKFRQRKLRCPTELSYTVELSCSPLRNILMETPSRMHCAFPYVEAGPHNPNFGQTFSLPFSLSLSLNISISNNWRAQWLRIEKRSVHQIDFIQLQHTKNVPVQLHGANDYFTILWINYFLFCCCSLFLYSRIQLIGTRTHKDTHAHRHHQPPPAAISGFCVAKAIATATFYVWSIAKNRQQFSASARAAHQRTCWSIDERANGTLNSPNRIRYRRLCGEIVCIRRFDKKCTHLECVDGDAAIARHRSVHAKPFPSIDGCPGTWQ